MSIHTLMNAMQIMPAGLQCDIWDQHYFASNIFAPKHLILTKDRYLAVLHCTCKMTFNTTIKYISMNMTLCMVNSSATVEHTAIKDI